MKIYNSLTKRKEEFTPQNPQDVKMYACGITVYDYAHIGHARQAITYEMIASYLRYRGYKLTYVRNYTDVDDKIIAKANAEGSNALEYSARKIKEVEEDLNALHVADADITPKASEYINKIINFVQGLIDNGHAYAIKKGDVYFSVKSFNEYGKLSNRNPDDMLNGVRIENEEEKKEPIDFALWKSAKEGEISWGSPWGKGRPGWHIECSTMAVNCLGDTIDIHGGGKDLIFPHHENEIAQSEAYTGKPFAKYWIHNGLIKVNGQKMSKSLGNSLTIRDAIAKYNYEVIRYAMLSKHYSTDVDLNEKEFALAERQVYYFYNTLNNIKTFLENNKVDVSGINASDLDISSKIKSDFIEAMDDDFNSSAAIAYLFTNCKYINSLIAEKKYSLEEKIYALTNIYNILLEVYGVIGLLKQEPIDIIENLRSKYLSMINMTSEEVDKLVNDRIEAKKEKNYSLADEIRNKLLDAGIILNDTKDGTTWDLKDLYTAN